MKRLAALMLLTACTAPPYNNLDLYLTKRGLSSPTSESFQTCRAYGCQKIDTITPTPGEWHKIDKAFSPKAKSAKAERKKIALAIATFENIVGGKNGTSEDIWGTFQKTGHKQQDCVDESTNTSIYLTVLKQRGHIHFHDIQAPTSRVPLLNPVSWPHQSAAITEKETNEVFVVDSWFHNNGAPPEIIPIETWKDGWKPQERQ